MVWVCFDLALIWSELALIWSGFAFGKLWLVWVFFGLALLWFRFAFWWLWFGWTRGGRGPDRPETAGATATVRWPTVAGGEGSGSR